MEYIYATLLLNAAGKKIDEKSVKKVLEAAGVKADAARIKALIASLEGIDIKDVISKSAAMPVAAAPAAPASSETKTEKKEEPKEEEKEISQEEAAEGLGALFG